MAGYYDDPAHNKGWVDGAWIDPNYRLGWTYDDMNRLHDQYGTDVRQLVANWNRDKAVKYGSGAGARDNRRNFSELTPDQQATILRGGSLGMMDFNADTIAATGLTRDQLAAFDKANGVQGTSLDPGDMGWTATQNIAGWIRSHGGDQSKFSALPPDFQKQIAASGAYNTEMQPGNEGDPPPKPPPDPGPQGGGGTPQPKPPQAPSMAPLMGGGGGGAAMPAAASGADRQGVGARAAKPSLQSFFGQGRLY